MARNSFDGRPTVIAAKQALATFNDELKPRQTDASPWGAFLSPVEGKQMLAKANELIQGVLDTVPEGRKVPPKALESIDAILASLRSKLPTASKGGGEPRLSELVMTLISSDRDTQRWRIDPDLIHSENRPIFAALQSKVDALHRR